MFLVTLIKKQKETEMVFMNSKKDIFLRRYSVGRGVSGLRGGITGAPGAQRAGTGVRGEDGVRVNPELRGRVEREEGLRVSLWTRPRRPESCSASRPRDPGPQGDETRTWAEFRGWGSSWKGPPRRAKTTRIACPIFPGSWSLRHVRHRTPTKEIGRAHV